MSPDNQALANELEQLCAHYDAVGGLSMHLAICDFVMKNRTDLLDCLRNKSYAKRADSATTFDPEKQFDKDHP